MIRRGFTLVEVMVSMVVLGIVALAAMQAMSFVSRQGVSTREKSFAARKCAQIMGELRAAGQQSVEALDAYHQAGETSLVLTLSAVGRDHPLSGNPDGKFRRQVHILPVEDRSDARRAEVRVYKAANGDLLAETVGILRRPSSVYRPAQVYDVYFLALENVAGHWTNPAGLKPLMRAMMKDLEIRNPGLEFREHWIKRLAIGRDALYAPYVNRNRDTRDAAAFPRAYILPGSTSNTAGGTPLTYFDFNDMPGRHAVDGTITGSLPMADQFNHALRQPEEWEAALAAAGSARGAREFTWRLFLESLWRGEIDHKNAILINLHGSALPAPPVRNYSDPAKAPDDVPHARVVTHPENLWYRTNMNGRNQDPIRLRVYSYHASTGPALNGIDADDGLPREITVRLPGVSGATVSLLEKNGGGHYQWKSASDPAEAHVDATAAGETRIRLRNSPMRHGQTAGGDGLNENARLYGWEYIPCDVGGGSAPFDQDLSAPGDRPKNTARWVIEIPADSVSGMLTVETRLADADSSTDDFALDGPRLSRTYAWVGATRDAVPVTERYQYMGDPRHMPYVDLKDEVAGGVVTDARYNWYFNGPPITPDPSAPGYSVFTDYRGFSRYAQEVVSGGASPVYPTSRIGPVPPDGTVVPVGWNTSSPQYLHVDVPRFHQLWREAMMTSGVVYNSVAGNFYGLLLMGGEFGGGYRDGLSNGLPVLRSLWTADHNDTTAVVADEARHSGGAQEKHLRLVQKRDGSWVSFPWLGELYPDGLYASEWVARGNLPSAGAAGFYRGPYAAPYSFMPSRSVSGLGPASLTLANSAGSGDTVFSAVEPLNYLTPVTVTATGRTLTEGFNASLPGTILAGRAFALNDGSAQRPPEWNTPPFTDRHRLTLVESYVSADGFTRTPPDTTLGLATLTPATPNGEAAHLVASGLLEQGQQGPAVLARTSLMTVLRAFLRLGAADIGVNQGRIEPLPRVEIVSPPDSASRAVGASVPIEWEADWTRWSGFPYTSDNAHAAGSLNDLTFNVKYSTDAVRWFCAQNDSPAEQGVPHPDAACRVTASASPIVFPWNTSGRSPGEHHVLVEVYRNDRRSHYSHHRTRVRFR